ncbi:hypothetical protein B9479_008063 [Cryptococcus floricola]|uniref:Uncharacterized protein n=1 Tax=Cryptococcus floricola TaxID=2591691 RepID=A0A5D3AMB6_9TREE|nr:hypothetical protein B9479_008063 [Cryptococcus floricola]
MSSITPSGFDTLLPVHHLILDQLITSASHPIAPQPQIIFG